VPHRSFKQELRKRTPIVIPEGFLSIGVESDKRRDLGWLSYVLWGRTTFPRPLLVKYYVIHNREYSRRDRHTYLRCTSLLKGHMSAKKGSRTGWRKWD